MRGTADLRTKILDFRGFDSSRILILRGGIPRPTGQFPGNLESTNLSREILSREIGHRGTCEPFWRLPLPGTGATRGPGRTRGRRTRSLRRSAYYQGPQRDPGPSNHIQQSQMRCIRCYSDK